MRSGGAVVKCPLANAGDTRDTGSIPGLARSPWSRRWQFTPIFFPGKSHGQRSLVGCSPWGRKESGTTERLHYLLIRASLVTQMVKNLPAKQETRVRSLGQEDPLEKKMATHSSILAWKISWTEKPGGLQSMGPQRVGMTEHTHSP